MMTVLDFYADWCSPCRMMNPIISKLEKEYEGRVSFVKVNADDNQEMTSKYGVQSLPTFVFEGTAGEMGRMIGATSEEKMRVEIERLLK